MSKKKLYQHSLKVTVSFADGSVIEFELADDSYFYREMPSNSSTTITDFVALANMLGFNIKHKLNGDAYIKKFVKGYDAYEKYFEMAIAEDTYTIVKNPSMVQILNDLDFYDIVALLKDELN